MEKTLIIVRGLPGSGKTTTAEFLAEGKYPVISADDFFTDARGKYTFERNNLGLAHEDCRLRTREAMVAGKEKVFVANTFTQEKEITPYAEMAKELGYRFVSVIIENRHGNKSVHGVPEETMVNMKNRFSIKL